MFGNMLIHLAPIHHIKELTTSTNPHHRDSCFNEFLKGLLLLIISMGIVICGGVSLFPIEARGYILSTSEAYQIRNILLKGMQNGKSIILKHPFILRGTPTYNIHKLTHYQSP
jgi:hypothetical protein